MVSPVSAGSAAIKPTTTNGKQPGPTNNTTGNTSNKATNPFAGFDFSKMAGMMAQTQHAQQAQQLASEAKTHDAKVDLDSAKVERKIALAKLDSFGLGGTVTDTTGGSGNNVDLQA